jgi:Ankyrin repeats (3 copies)
MFVRVRGGLYGMSMRTRAGYVASGLVSFFVGVAAVAAWQAFSRPRLKAWPNEPPVAFQPAAAAAQAHPCPAGYYIWIPEADERHGEVYDPYCYPLQGELYSAASGGDLERVRAALRAGANVDGHLDDNTTALPAAVANGHTEVARLLLDNGAQVNQGDGIHWPPLYRAVYRHDAETVNLLLARGAKFTWGCDFEARAGQTPLQFAEAHGDEEIVALLDEAGASSWRHRVNRRVAKLTGNRYRQIFSE